MSDAGTNTNASVQIVNCTNFDAGLEPFVLIFAQQTWGIELAVSNADRLGHDGGQCCKAGMHAG